MSNNRVIYLPPYMKPRAARSNWAQPVYNDEATMSQIYVNETQGEIWSTSDKGKIAVARITDGSYKELIQVSSNMLGYRQQDQTEIRTNMPWVKVANPNILVIRSSATNTNNVPQIAGINTETKALHLSLYQTGTNNIGGMQYNEGRIEYNPLDNRIWQAGESVKTVDGTSTKLPAITQFVVTNNTSLPEDDIFLPAPYYYEFTIDTVNGGIWIRNATGFNIIELSTRNTIATSIGGPNYSGASLRMMFIPEKQKVLVINKDNSTVTMFDGNNFTHTGFTYTAPNPSNIQLPVYIPQTDELYFNINDSVTGGGIQVLNANTLAPTRRIFKQTDQFYKSLGPLAKDSAGNLYGTARYDDYVNSKGTHDYIFRLSQSYMNSNMNIELDYHPAPAPFEGTTVSYTESSATIANPERGFAYQRGASQNADYFQGVEYLRTNDGITVVWMLVYLNDFINSDIDAATLTNIQNNFNDIRTGGVKAWLRFSYEQIDSGIDATKTRIKRHIDQLKPILQANDDVIAVMDAGFIGSWGEWAHSNNFGNEGSFTGQNWADRREVLEYLLDALPVTRKVMIRVPGYKQFLYGYEPITDATAYSNKYAARIGHHNDALMSNETDMGTWGLINNIEYDRDYVSKETQFLPAGGESSAYNSADPTISSCPLAVPYLRRYHFSFLNNSYHPGVIQQWKDNGCYTEIANKLGYRFVLTNCKYPTTANSGQYIRVEFNINNVGFASPFNFRTPKLILRNTSNNQEFVVNMTADVRRWFPGMTTIRERLLLPSMPAGNYKLFLSLPDAAASLSSMPAYAIQLANVGVWEASTGYNDLKHTITIS